MEPAEPEQRNARSGSSPSLRALFFDVDGTLAETERYGHRLAYNRAFRELGLPWRWTPRLYRKLLQQPGGRERLQHYLVNYGPELGPQRAAAQADVETWVRDVHALKSRHFSRLVRGGRVPLRRGVGRLMREAHAAGVKIAVVSNASRASLQPLLEHSLGAELHAMLSLVVCGDEALRKKPAPDLYRHALNQLGVTSNECVAIEDSALGLSAARAAGIPTVITVNSETRSDDFSGALLVLDGLGEPDAPPRVLRGRLNNASGTYCGERSESRSECEGTRPTDGPRNGSSCVTIPLLEALLVESARDAPQSRVA